MLKAIRNTITAAADQINQAHVEQLQKQPPISWRKDPLGRIEQIWNLKDASRASQIWSNCSIGAGTLVGTTFAIVTARALLMHPLLSLQLVDPTSPIVSLALLVASPSIVGVLTGVATTVSLEFCGDMVRQKLVNPLN